jgi:hypothetical protein
LRAPEACHFFPFWKKNSSQFSTFKHRQTTPDSPCDAASANTTDQNKIKIYLIPIYSVPLEIYFCTS